LRSNLISGFFSLISFNHLLFSSLELLVHVTSDGSMDVVEALQLVSGDDRLLLLVLSSFLKFHGGRVVGFSLEASSSAQDGGLNSGSTGLSAADEVTVALGVDVAKLVLGKSSRSLLLFGRVFEFFVEALTDTLAKSINTTRSTRGLRPSLVGHTAGGRSLVSYSVEILLRVVGLGGRLSAAIA